jgi:hypothetical protein
MIHESRIGKDVGRRGGGPEFEPSTSRIRSRNDIHPIARIDSHDFFVAKFITTERKKIRVLMFVNALLRKFAN